MEEIKCKNCELLLTGKFCSNCGQKLYSQKDKSISLLLQEALHFITHFEGKLFYTLKTIYKNPGKLSIDYGEGVRQKYYKPVSLYLLLIVTYLLFPLAEGMNMKLVNYETNSNLSRYISSKIKNNLSLNNITKEQLSEKFDEKSQKVSKFLLLSLIPLSAPIFYILYFYKKRYVFDNYILLTEINIFFLLSFFILFPILLLPFIYLFKISGENVDPFYGPFVLAVFGFYCVFIFNKVFNEKWWISTIKGAIFAPLFMLMITSIYRIIVFEITFALL